jgi:hypothetical protein
MGYIMVNVSVRDSNAFQCFFMAQCQEPVPWLDHDKFKSQGSNTLSEITIKESVRTAIAFSWQGFFVDFPND